MDEKFPTRRIEEILIFRLVKIIYEWIAPSSPSCHEATDRLYEIMFYFVVSNEDARNHRKHHKQHPNRTSHLADCYFILRMCFSPKLLTILFLIRLACCSCSQNIIIIIIIKDIYIAPFRHAPKALCKKKVKC